MHIYKKLVTAPPPSVGLASNEAIIMTGFKYALFSNFTLGMLALGLTVFAPKILSAIPVSRIILTCVLVGLAIGAVSAGRLVRQNRKIRQQYGDNAPTKNPGNHIAFSSVRYASSSGLAIKIANSVGAGVSSIASFISIALVFLSTAAYMFKQAFKRKTQSSDQKPDVTTNNPLRMQNLPALPERTASFKQEPPTLTDLMSKAGKRQRSVSPDLEEIFKGMTQTPPLPIKPKPKLRDKLSSFFLFKPLKVTALLVVLAGSMFSFSNNIGLVAIGAALLTSIALAVYQHVKTKRVDSRVSSPVTLSSASRKSSTSLSSLSNSHAILTKPKSPPPLSPIDETLDKSSPIAPTPVRAKKSPDARPRSPVAEPKASPIAPAPERTSGFRQ